MSGPAASAGSAENAQGAESEPNTRWRGFWGRCLIAVLIASAFMTSAVAMVDREITDKVTEIPRVVGLELAPTPPGGANYLIIGSDTRSFVHDENDALQFGDPNADPDLEGQRSDTLMVAHVEPSSQKTFVVSFPRDLMVNVPGTQGLSRINSAYSNGGAQLVIETLKANFNIEINHYLEVNFESFREIVNTIGNVWVYLPGRVRDLQLGDLSPYGGGCYEIDGQAALTYVRSRKLQVSDPNGEYIDPDTGEHWRSLDIRADLDRIARQQTFIRKLAGLAIERALGDPFLAVSLTDSVLEYIQADENLNRDDVNALVRAFRTVDVSDPGSIRFETLPTDPDPDNPTATLVPAASAEAVVEQLRTFGDDTPKPLKVQPSQVSVRITDATGTNVGASVEQALDDQGFTATQTKVGAGVPVTEIHYSFGQAEEAKLLLSYFPDAKLVPDAAAKGAAIVVLGTSFPGTIVVPSTTTTAPPASTVPGAPVPTAPIATTPPTTTTLLPSDTCGQ